jgi:hypothetical protein
MSSRVTSARYAMGMTFDQYVDYVGTPANLARESGWSAGPKRVDFSGPLREAYTPKLARLADAGGMELRIFTRDGQAVSHGPRANPADAPNADIVNAFLNERDVYRYIKFPAIYHKARLWAAMEAAAAGDTREQAWSQFLRDWRALQDSPFFALWASAAIDEILSALHERLVVAPAVGESVAT